MAFRSCPIVIFVTMMVVLLSSHAEGLQCIQGEGSSMRKGNCPDSNTTECYVKLFLNWNPTSHRHEINVERGCGGIKGTKPNRCMDRRNNSRKFCVCSTRDNCNDCKDWKSCAQKIDPGSSTRPSINDDHNQLCSCQCSTDQKAMRDIYNRGV